MLSAKTLASHREENYLNSDLIFPIDLIKSSKLLKVMGSQMEINDLKKTHTNLYPLGTFSVDTNYIVIN